MIPRSLLSNSQISHCDLSKPMTDGGKSTRDRSHTAVTLMYRPGFVHTLRARYGIECLIALRIARTIFTMSFLQG
jgi:hypothetical protein